MKLYNKENFPEKYETRSIHHGQFRASFLLFVNIDINFDQDLFKNEVFQ